MAEPEYEVEFRSRHPARLSFLFITCNRNPVNPVAAHNQTGITAMRIDKPDSKPVYFHTGNSALALALHTVGVRLVEIVNIYDPATLEKMRCTAREAWKRGIPGRIIYYFDQSAGIKHLTDAWNDQLKELKAETPNTTLEDVTNEEAMRILCIGLTKRRAFNELWQEVTPMLLVPKDGEIERKDVVTAEDPKTGEERIVSMTEIRPGFKLVSIDMPDKVAAEVA